ncbi:2-hydroxychromene-2-carboxylate isomerase [Salipiger sp. H15]|uniref:2-hydroxychromene-2-carboxylate isomerase n=1 Tax=Alloyangia sp. H15 TaxID=3029062 RepID=UPI003364BE6A
MTLPPVIDYFFAPMSGYGYLGHQELMGLARRAGAKVRFLPMEVAKVYEAAGVTPPYDHTDPRRTYRIEDQARWARIRGLPMAAMPPSWPTDPRLACRCILAAGRLGLDQDEVTFACLRGVWAEHRNLADPGDLQEAFESVDLPAARILALAQREELRDEADAVTAEAIEKGIFGSPTYVLHGKRYYGQDRFDFLGEALQRAAA